MNNAGDKYLVKCKENYLKGITPSNSRQIEEEAYKETVAIAIACIKTYGVENFSSFFQESQYLVNLWTAHFILKYANPDDKLKSKSLEVIKNYSSTPLAPKLAEEEKVWLLENYPEYA